MAIKVPGGPDIDVGGQRELLGDVLQAVACLHTELEALEAELAPCLEPLNTSTQVDSDMEPPKPIPPLLVQRDKLQNEIQNAINRIGCMRERIQWP